MRAIERGRDRDVETSDLKYRRPPTSSLLRPLNLQTAMYASELEMQNGLRTTGIGYNMQLKMRVMCMFLELKLPFATSVFWMCK